MSAHTDFWQPSLDIHPKIYVLYYIYYCCDDATKRQLGYTCRKLALLYYHDGRQRCGVAAARFWQYGRRLRLQHEFNWSQTYGDACRWRPNRTIVLRGMPRDGDDCLYSNHYLHANNYTRVEWNGGLQFIDARLVARCIEITGARNYAHAIAWQHVRLVKLRTPDACAHLLSLLIRINVEMCCKIYGFNARHDSCYIRFCHKLVNGQSKYRITAHRCCNVEIPTVDHEKLVYRTCRI